MTEPDECPCGECQFPVLLTWRRVGAELLALLLRKAQPAPHCALVDELLAELDDAVRAP